MSLQRKITSYLPYIDGIVYVVDASDPQRFEESKSDLDDILGDVAGANKPVLILGNKIDIVSALPEIGIIKAFDLNPTGKNPQNIPAANINMRPLEVFMCSAHRQAGYVEGFKWLCNFVIK